MKDELNTQQPDRNLVPFEINPFYTLTRDVFRSLSKVYDGVFLRKSLKTKMLFTHQNSAIDV